MNSFRLNKDCAKLRQPVSGPPAESCSLNWMRLDCAASSCARSSVARSLSPGLRLATTSDSVMTGIREIVARVKARGFKMIGVTIIPRHNATWTPLMTQYRNEINAWIRSRSSGLDAVIDFDKVMRDASNPDLMNPILDLGDHIHPNPYGYLLMGKAIDTSIFDDRDDDRDRDDD